MGIRLSDGPGPHAAGSGAAVFLLQMDEVAVGAHAGMPPGRPRRGLMTADRATLVRHALAMALLLAPTTLRAAELETTHLFGFTLGSDVNAVGEKEAELETVGSFGKRFGDYAAAS